MRSILVVGVVLAAGMAEALAGEDVARADAENWRRHAGHAERYE